MKLGNNISWSIHLAIYQISYQYDISELRSNFSGRLWFGFGAVAIMWREIVEPSLRVDFRSAGLSGS